MLYIAGRFTLTMRFSPRMLITTVLPFAPCSTMSVTAKSAAWRA